MRPAGSLQNGGILREGADLFCDYPGVSFFNALFPARRTDFLRKLAPSSNGSAEQVRDENLGKIHSGRHCGSTAKSDTTARK